MSKLARDFKKYGWRGLALSLAFVAGMATSKPTKAMSYDSYVSKNNNIRYEQSIDSFNEAPKQIVEFKNIIETKNETCSANSCQTYMNPAQVVLLNQNELSTYIPEAQITPITETTNKRVVKMYYNDEELIAQGKDPEHSCGDNYIYVTPIDVKSSTNTKSTNEIVNASIEHQALSRKNEDGTATTIGTTKDGKTYSTGGSTTTSPNGVTTVMNSNNTATIYQNVNGNLMKRDINTEGTKNYSREMGEFTPEGDLNLGWWGIGTNDLGVDGVFQNSEGSTVIVTNNGQTVTTIDHSTGGVSTYQCSQATAEGGLARAAYYGQPYYEFYSAKGHYDVGTNLAETCMNGQCGIREVEVINGQVQLMSGEYICSSNC